MEEEVEGMEAQMSVVFAVEGTGDVVDQIDAGLSSSSSSSLFVLLEFIRRLEFRERAEEEEEEAKLSKFDHRL